MIDISKTIDPDARLYLMAVNRPDLGNLGPFILYSTPSDIVSHIKQCALSAVWQEEVNPDMDLDCPDIEWGDVYKAEEITKPTPFLLNYGIPWGQATVGQLVARSILDLMLEAKEQRATLKRERENARRQTSLIDAVNGRHS